MNFTDSIKSAFVRCFDYETRSSRSEFWWFQLFSFIASFLALLISAALSMGEVLSYIVDILLLVPSISLAARRLHDIGLSGWWQAIILSIIGLVPLIIWWCTKSNDGRNRFGDNPLEHPYDLEGEHASVIMPSKAKSFETESVYPKEDEIYQPREAAHSEMNVVTKTEPKRMPKKEKKTSDKDLIDKGFNVVRKVDK